MSERAALLLVLVFLAAIRTMPIVPSSFAVEPPGFVIIREDGSVEGTDKIQRVGDVYTLRGDINVDSAEWVHSGIQVLKDNIVIDGARFCLFASGLSGNGIDLSDRNNVEIKNLRISGFLIGVLLNNASNNRIHANEITGYSGGGPYGVPTGIWLSLSSNNRITSNKVTANNEYGISVHAASANNFLQGNVVTENGVGIVIDYCPNNTLRNNQMTGNELNFKLGYNSFEQFMQDIDTSNTVEGKPVYYWLYEHNKTVPSNAGFVALGNCTNIVVKDLQISNSYDSITLINTNDSVLAGNSINKCATGIFLKYCRNVNVTGNTITGNVDSGIGTIECSNILIAENSIDSCKFGISTAGQTARHSGGWGSTNMTIFRNNITNCDPGVYFSLSSNNLVSQNSFRGNAYGVNLVASSKNNFTENTFVENSGGALRISDAFNNTFFCNNFIDNELDSQVLTRWYYARVYETNIWDNGHEGNYWSNFKDRYPNASEISPTRTWNTAFYIDDVNIDHYPLVNPHEIGTDKPADSLLPLISPLHVLVTFSVALVAVATGVGLLICFKKRRKIKNA